MKFKKYRKFINKKIPLIKFFYKIYNKEKRKNIKYYDRLSKSFEFKYKNIYWYDACSNEKEKNFFKKINIYNVLKKISEDEYHYFIPFPLYKNNKTSWYIYYYDDVSVDHEGQPSGNSGIKIYYSNNKHKKHKQLIIILNNWY